MGDDSEGSVVGSTSKTLVEKPLRFDPNLKPPAPTTALKRAEANIEALELLNALEDAQRWPTAAEQQILAGYRSWGGAAQIFDRTRPEWAPLRQRLEAAVSADVYHQLEETTLTAFFTGDDIIKPVWDALGQAGLTTGTVLEPGSGTGNFFAHAPEDVQMVGVEQDEISARISRLLYPDATVIQQGFEDVATPPDTFTAAIGNVPLTVPIACFTNILSLECRGKAI
ncbi:hypothetical protein [Corynebacterium sp. HS2168-gen11]|uniref:hypothetical protein n=1 Tax=Corynebacterium sp. HS2168-gen11 TaxID=2974027 RepID=UPI00216AC3C3|nr:hypothetical protein [Corynebacterium sp. HS2168-gen11]MCS4536238.1 hypothetical protein [Corynebacterium sp. HS2168-gen11]